jgi:hypothetical protein
MGEKAIIVTFAGLRSRRGIALSAAVCLAASFILLAQPASAQSLSDRFKGLFGGKPDEPPAQGAAAPPAAPEGQDDLTCPPVSIRAGASTFAIGLAGKPASGSDLRYQATITRTARQCTVNGGQITARIGIQGRVIGGPAWTAGTVEIPVRVAVVQGGVSEKTIATKAFQTTVSMADSDNVPYSLVIEDLVYPVPPGATGDAYIFYIGFDPQALKPEAKPRVVKKK